MENNLNEEILISQEEISKRLQEQMSKRNQGQQEQPIYTNQSKVKMYKTHIYFYTQIDRQSVLQFKLLMEQLISNLLSISQIDFRKQLQIKIPIHIHISSCGGTVYHGLYLYDYITSIKNKYPNIKIYTYVDGFIASAATLMYLSGDERYMTKNSFLMLHQLSSVQAGKLKDLSIQMKLNLKLMNKIYDIYLKYMNKFTKKKLASYLERDNTIDAQESLHHNITTKII